MTFSSLAADTLKKALFLFRALTRMSTNKFRSIEKLAMSYIKRGLMEEMSTFVAMEAAQQTIHIANDLITVSVLAEEATSYPVYV